MLTDSILEQKQASIADQYGMASPQLRELPADLETPISIYLKLAGDNPSFSKEGADTFGLMSATFPAGTVSGAPKIRAMQIIAELEKDPRGPYVGAMGYYSYDGSMDTCITIRTLLLRGQRLYMQAGAGIVADSNPEAEYQETLNKLPALAQAVEIAETKP